MAAMNWVTGCIVFFALTSKNLRVKSVVCFQLLYVTLCYAFCEDITLLDFILLCSLCPHFLTNLI